MELHFEMSCMEGNSEVEKFVDPGNMMQVEAQDTVKMENAGVTNSEFKVENDYIHYALPAFEDIACQKAEM